MLVMLSVPAVSANAVGALVGALTNYFLQFYVTFQSRSSHGRSSITYALGCALSWLANTALFALLYTQLQMPILIAQVVTTLIIACANFIIYDRWVFRA